MLNARLIIGAALIGLALSWPVSDAVGLPLDAAPTAQENVVPKDTVANGDADATAVVFLEHAGCVDVAKKVRSLFQADDDVNKATWYGPLNAVLLRSTPREVKLMAEMIKSLDVAPGPAPEEPSEPEGELRIFPIKHADAKVLADTLERVHVILWGRRGPNVTKGRNRRSVAVDARTNSIIVNADPDSLDVVARLIAALDVPSERTEPNIGDAPNDDTK